MIRRSIGITMLAILASATATGTDFHVAARVDVVATLSVSAAAPQGEAAGDRAILVEGTQDQCLGVTWLLDEGQPVSSTVVVSSDGAMTYIVSGDEVTLPDREVHTIQIIVN